MRFDDPLALKERLAREATVRALCVGRPHPGPAGMRMLRLLGGIFRTTARWYVIASIGAVVAITVGEVLLMLRLNTWNADFFNVLEQRALDGLIVQTWIFVAIVASIMFLQAGSLQTKLRLQISLRSYLTRTVADAWMAEGRQYRLRNMLAKHDNEDGRIAEDARIVCEMVVEFLVSLLYALLQLVLFVGVLWFHSGPLTITIGSAAITLPGHMVWVAFLYAGVGAAITIFIGHPLVRATERRQAAEAHYRAQLANGIENASSIALTRAEAGERRRLTSAFDHIREAWNIQTASFRNLIFFSAGYAQLTMVLPLLILAPRYFSGEMNLGTLMQVTIAFGQVTGALSWLSSNYPSMAQWEASAERVLLLHEAVADIGDGYCSGANGRFQRVQENGPCLTFRDLSLVSPDGQVLVQHFSGEIKPGELVLVEATPQGAEALFRAVAGLSLWGAGRIEMPENSEPFFMGERPYLPVATLLEVLTEPRPHQEFPEGKIAKILADVGLTQLVPMLDMVAAWAHQLGIEDQQRLSFARALLHQPRWILMHDATSALDATTEGSLLDLLTHHLPETAVVTITHRPIPEWRFRRRISLSTGETHPVDVPSAEAATQ